MSPAEGNSYDESSNTVTPVAPKDNIQQVISTERSKWLTAIELFFHPLNLTTLNSYITVSSYDRETRQPETLTVV
jgi:hypothetical protein